LRLRLSQISQTTLAGQVDGRKPVTADIRG
jgi:hypothetical protein